MRSDVRSSSCAPENPAACSANCRRLSCSIAMRSLSSDKESELSLLIFVPDVLERKARPDEGSGVTRLFFFGGRRITLRPSALSSAAQANAYSPSVALKQRANAL